MIAKPRHQAVVIVPDFTAHVIDQPLDRYGATDHRTWATLFERQSALLPGRACRDFVAGMHGLGMVAGGIPDFQQLSDLIEPRSGWRIVAVAGLVPDDVFFAMLASRRFPVTWWIRTPEQLDYIQEPDAFHDLFGHVPMLMNPVFGDYMAAYGRGGLKALRLNALAYLARLYWYTVEFGLIREEGSLHIYGSGIVSSRSEVLYSLESANPNRLAFDLRRIMRTRYRIDTFQRTYFVIDSFAQLFDATAPDFTPIYADLKTRTDIGAGDVLATDRVLHRGLGKDWVADAADA